MPVPRARKIVTKTKSALFAKTLDGAPTPWIGAEWIDNEGATVAVKYRLWIRRRGRTLHVEMHKDSAFMPGHVKAVRMSRGGSYDVLKSGTALVHCARWDPDVPPNYPRSVWNVNARDYSLRLEHARTVCLALPRFLTPQRGRPRITAKDNPVNPNMPISLRGAGRAASRRKQRNELLVMTQRLTNIMIPIVERCSDPRRMNGYIQAEQAIIWRALNDLTRGIRQLHEQVFYDRWGYERPDAAPTVEEQAPADPIEGFTIEDLEAAQRAANAARSEAGVRAWEAEQERKRLAALQGSVTTVPQDLTP